MHFFTVLPGGYLGGAFANVIAFNIAYEGGAFNFGAVLIFGGAFLGGSFGTDGALFQIVLRTGGFFLGTGGTGGAFVGFDTLAVELADVQLLLEDDDAPWTSMSVTSGTSASGSLIASGCVFSCQATHSLSPAQCPSLPHTLH